MAQEGAISDGEELSSRADSSAWTAAGTRKNFTVTDDLTLLRCINLVRPWEAAVGTSNGIMRAFETIAEKCRSVEGFVKKDGPAVRTRFNRLVRVFRAQQRSSLRSSGTTEEYEERDVLLQDIVCRMDNWKEKTEEAKALERAKNDGIESSGELMRRLAMAELEAEDDEDLSSAEEEEDTGDQAPAHAASASATSSSTQGTNAAQIGRKRATPRGKSRAQKSSKREKLAVVRDSLAQAIDGSLSDASAKYAYLRERLSFELEQAARRLSYDAKRMDADMEREERREAADREREKENQAFMVKLLEITMGKANGN